MFNLESVVDKIRESYMLDDVHMDTHRGLPRHVHRASVYDDVMMMYKDHFPEIEKVSFSYKVCK